MDRERLAEVARRHGAILLFWKVVQHCRLLHGSPRRLAELKMYAFRRYQDHRRYLALEGPYVERALRQLARA